MNSNNSHPFDRLSEKAMKLRQGNCPKLDIRSKKQLTDQDRAAFENIRVTTGWEELTYRNDGKDNVIQFRMPSITEVDPDAVQSCTTYL
jgi:hypothetical protein